VIEAPNAPFTATPLKTENGAIRLNPSATTDGSVRNI